MSSATTILYAFLGGAVVGAASALLFAPEKGEDLRQRIKAALRRRGICCSDDELDVLVEKLTAEVDE